MTADDSKVFETRPDVLHRYGTYVRSDTTTMTTVNGAKSISTTADVPNLFLVIDAVRSRGGRVTIGSGVFEPRRAA